MTSNRSRTETKLNRSPRNRKTSRKSKSFFSLLSQFLIFILMIRKRYANTIYLEISRQKKEKLEAASNAPQVKVNPDGSICIDEMSLVVDRRDQSSAPDFETVDETSGFRSGGRGPRLTSMSFRKNRIPGRG